VGCDFPKFGRHFAADEIAFLDGEAFGFGEPQEFALPLGRDDAGGEPVANGACSKVEGTSDMALSSEEGDDVFGAGRFGNCRVYANNFDVVGVCV
jgi:hypothetical protein